MINPVLKAIQMGASFMLKLKNVETAMLILSFIPSSLTTINLQGCALVHEGAHLPASKTAFTFSSSIGVDLNRTLLLRSLIASRTGLIIISPKLNIHIRDKKHAPTPAL